MKSPGPLLAIRADASHRTGTGHIMRTLAIAQEWLARGGRVRYLCSEIPEPLARRLLAAGVEISRIDPKQDAADTAASATAGNALVLLVDHYGLDATWWLALPPVHHWKTAALNDFNEPLHHQSQLRFSPRAAPVTGDPHSGPAFLLIRREIRRSAPPAAASPSATRLLLVLGGADPENAGPRTASSILTGYPHLHLRAIVGPAAANLAEFQQLALHNDHLEVVSAPDSMRPHFEWADTAIVSPSTTAFEVLHHGLPTGLILTAGNQEEVCADLTRQNAAILLADARHPGLDLDPSALTLLLSNAGSRSTLATAGSALVDGDGPARICNALGLPELAFRPATLDDARVTWQWANDPQTRVASFSSEFISWEDHSRWFARRLTQADPTWLAVDPADKSLAFLRFDAAEPGIHLISINLSPEIRGLGLSALIVSRAIAAFRSDHPHAIIHAWIKPENHASRRCFTKAGFQEADGNAEPDRLLYIQCP